MTDTNPDLAQQSTEWADELADIAQRRAAAAQMGGPEAVAKLRAAGKQTARERVAALLDNGSFREFGGLTGKGRYDAEQRLESFTPSAHVLGLGRIDGRRIVAIADDSTIRGGSSEAVIAEKWIYADRYAHEYQLPLVRLVDSAGGSVKLIEQMGHTKIPGYALLPQAALLGLAPVVGIAMGACAGLGALRVACAHFAILVRGVGQVFAGGPPVVKQALGQDLTKEQLGGYEVHRRSGVIHNAADTEEDAFALTRRFLSYLPTNVWEAPPVLPCDDDPERVAERCDSARPPQALRRAPRTRDAGRSRLGVRNGARLRRLRHHRVRTPRWSPGRRDCR
jgi:acetyl-CoA carboxylase carboxyltransferase component